MSKDMAGRPVEGDLVAPLDEAEARALTDEIRAAIKGVKAATGRLAAAVRRAHEARVWVTLRYPSWKAYAKAEFGIGRSHAYRLVDQAVTAEELETALVELGLMSPAGDADVLGELSGRAWREIQGRAHDVASRVAERAALLEAPVDVELLHTLVAEAVDHVRAPEPDGDLLLGRRAMDAAPAHLSDRQATARLRRLAEEVGEPVPFLLACRRYAQSGDARAVETYRQHLTALEIVREQTAARFALGDYVNEEVPIGLPEDEAAARLQALTELGPEDPAGARYRECVRRARDADRRLGEYALGVYPADQPWDETGAQVLGDLADELGIPFGELFTCRLFALTGSDLPVRFWEEVNAPA
ncbi:hypothetical protein ACFYZ9_35400 [Streptomyces sp. NPDC001691]|uniref:hypothetical protein n=1 Tax=Streptomyces sp. NPDC001691 TaxID=3364600 RepID=UPI0036A84436